MSEEKKEERSPLTKEEIREFMKKTGMAEVLEELKNKVKSKEKQE